jgi:hypothetical protein
MKRTKGSQLDYSTHGRDSNPEYSAKDYQFHSKLEDQEATRFKQETPINEVYGFTDIKTAPTDSKITSTHIEKSDDQVSSDSIFCNSSIHESQSSRKSLTKK